MCPGDLVSDMGRIPAFRDLLLTVTIYNIFGGLSGYSGKSFNYLEGFRCTDTRVMVLR